MIEPFVDGQKREGVISYGLSSYGYDARVGNEFKIFTNVDSAPSSIPKNFASQQLRRPHHRRLHHPAQLLRPGAHGRVFPHAARRAGDLRRQIDLRALRHHRQRDAAGAGMGRPRDAGVLQHHAAAGARSTPTRAPASSCSCRATSPARSPIATSAASTRASAASPCRGSEERHRWTDIRIRGGRPLNGEIPISGAKNAALPLMAAGLLTDETLTLLNVPHLADIVTMSHLLTQHGVEVSARRRPRTAMPAARRSTCRRRRSRDHGALRPGAQDARLGAGAGAAGGALRPGEGVAARRLRHRHAAGRPAPQGPGGAGRRDRARRRLHRSPRAPKGLRGASIVFPKVSVGATENLLMAATPRQGRDRAGQRRARAGDHRPRDCLVAMGAKIERHRHRHADASRASTRCTAPRTRVIPDRIEAGTYAMAAAITGGDARAGRRRGST